MRHRIQIRFSTTGVVVAAVFLALPPFLFLGVLSSQNKGIDRILEISILVVAVISLLVVAVVRHLIRPLKKITECAGNFSVESPILLKEDYFLREMAVLSRSMNNMIEATMDGEELYRRMKDNFQERLDEQDRVHRGNIESLKNARNHWLLPEKMGAIGSLVSGIAQEINTPLSIGVTAASFLNERARTMRNDWDRQALTQEDFERFLQDAQESSSIIQDNLDQAARIVISLKQVAEDQQTDELRKFELGSYLHDVALSLKHQFKLGKDVLSVNHEGVVMVETYPGVITRILDNLLSYSVMQGGGEKEWGRIDIDVRGVGDEVELRYSDVDLSNWGSFSASRDVKGRDEGMKSIRQLVADKLGGTVDLTESAEMGSGFTLRFPKA